MSANLSQKLEQLQESIKTQREILQTLNQLIKKQAMRTLKLQSIFKFDKSYEEILGNIYGNTDNIVYEDYMKLLSKQICGKITQLIKQLDEVKNSLSKLAIEIKSNKGNQAQEAFSEIQNKVEGVKEMLNTMWHNNSFLMANYRLDIAAKELQKWNKGLNTGQNQARITQEVDDLFK